MLTVLKNILKFTNVCCLVLLHLSPTQENLVLQYPLEFGSLPWLTVSSSLAPCLLVARLLDASERDSRCTAAIKMGSLLHSASRASILWFWRERRARTLASSSSSLTEILDKALLLSCVVSSWHSKIFLNS